MLLRRRLGGNYIYEEGKSLKALTASVTKPRPVTGVVSQGGSALCSLQPSPCILTGWLSQQQHQQKQYILRRIPPSSVSVPFYILVYMELFSPSVIRGYAP